MKRMLFNALLVIVFMGVAAIGQQEAFAAGTITGSVETKRAKYKKNVVVYLKNVQGTFNAPQEPYVVDQQDLTFIPHVLPVLVGSKVNFKNSDNVNHNVFSPTECKSFNLGTFGPGGYKTVTFDKTCVVDLLCNVHSEMSAYVVVLDNPYFSLTGADGSFTIRNVPAGTYEIAVWSEKMKAETQSVTVSDGSSATVTFNLTR
ncbi:MAG: carboxypeptidase regulatory-like domain-containing protein [Chlorobiales bacterium]|nr:carboxypeptidase regulatory-like domain-containing protein [Chlorobiales bacterium]